MPAMQEVHYFAYGANMSTDVFVARRRMRPISSERAELPGYELVFSCVGFPLVEPAFATIREAAGGTAHGVLHRLGEDDARALDALEEGYRHFEVDIVGAVSGKVRARAFAAEHTAEGLLPSARYRNLLLAGAREFALPAAYISWLEAHPTAPLSILSNTFARAIPLAERLMRAGLSPLALVESALRAHQRFWGKGGTEKQGTEKPGPRKE